MWMRASEEQLKAGVMAIKLENHEGLWMEKPDLFNKYLRRPDHLEEMCLAQFAKMYKGSAASNEDSEQAFDEGKDVDLPGTNWRGQIPLHHDLQKQWLKR